MYLRNIKLTKHQVFSKNFNRKGDIASRFSKFKSVGLNPSIRTKGTSNILELGVFSKEKDADIAIEKLKKDKLKLNKKRVITNQKVYAVRTKKFPTKNKAQEIEKKLINLGLKKSFIQYE